MRRPKQTRHRISRYFFERTGSLMSFDGELLMLSTHVYDYDF